MSKQKQQEVEKPADAEQAPPAVDRQADDDAPHVDPNVLAKALLEKKRDVPQPIKREPKAMTLPMGIRRKDF